MTTRYISDVRRVVSASTEYSLKFVNASSQKVVITQTSGLPIFSQSGYTISGWFNYSGNISGNGELYSEGNTGSNNQIIDLHVTGTTNPKKIEITIRNDANTTQLNGIRSTQMVLPGRWNHFIWVDNNGTCALYINGILDSTNFNYTPAGSYTLNTSGIGVLNRSSPANFFDGFLKDFRVFNTSFTANQALDLFFKRKNAITPKGWWNFNENTGSTATDSSGNGNNGTITGATYSTSVPPHMAPRTSVSNRAILRGKQPNQISGLVAWWKPEGLTGFSNGDPVATWPDSSGNGNDLTGTGSERPTYTTNLLNGFAGLRFDGVANKLVKTGIVTANPFTIIAVYKKQGSLNDDGREVAGITGNWLMGVRQNKFQVFNTTAFLPTGNLLPAADTAYVHSVIQQTNLAKQYIASSGFGVTLLGTSTSANGSPNGIGICNRTSEFQQSDMFEVIIFNSVLSLPDILSLNYYLGYKYNLTSLKPSRTAV